MNDKNQLLETTQEKIITRKPMGVRFFVTLLLMFAIGWMLLFPRIYINNAIYYKSRGISVLQREYETLKEENRIIRSRIEAMRFQIQIVDAMEVQEES